LVTKLKHIKVKNSQNPAIGRFWQIDPLAEDYMYNSTYSFQENKMGMGVELEGLELAGLDVAIYVSTKASEFSANTLGARNQIGQTLNKRVDSHVNGTARNNDNSGFANFSVSDVQDISAVGDGLNTISEEAAATAKGVARDTANALEDTGDVITLAGIATAQPEIVVVGEGLSGLGGGINDALDYSEGKPAGDIIIDRIDKIIIGRRFKELSDKLESVHSPLTKTAEKLGENVITETIINSNEE